MKKILSLILAAVLLCGSVFALASCAGDPSKQLVVATNANFAPFEYKEGNKFAGIDMEIAKLIADELGLELVIEDMDFDSVVTSVGKNNVDVAMAGLTVNEKRKQSVDFTDSYYNASQMLIVLANDTSFDACTTAEEVLAKLDELKGTNEIEIGVQSGTTGQYFVDGDADWEFDGIDGYKSKGYQNGGLAVNDMKNGAVKYVMIDEQPAKQLVKAVSGIKVIDIPLTVEEYAFGVDKAQPELRAQINEILARIKSDGTLDNIIKAYATGVGIKPVTSATKK